MRESSTGDRPNQQPDEHGQPIRHIAVCLDRSPVGDRAMPHAVAVAKAFDAHITALHVLEPSHDRTRAALTDPLEWEVQRTEAERHLDGLQSEYAVAGPGGEGGPGSVGSEVLEGRPAEAIRNWVGTHGVDLTVLTSHGERGRTEWALASTARKLVEGVSGSLLVVPARPVGPRSGRPVEYRRVLVPLDGSARAECALAVATRIAMSAGSELLLLHVVPRLPDPCPGPLDDEERDLDRRLVDRNLRVATAYLESLAKRVEGDGIRVRTQVGVDSDVRDEIQARVAVDDVDLVVLSGHGHGGRAQQPVGTVTSFLLEGITVPLLIVRDPSPLAPSTSAEGQGHTGVRLPHLTDE